MSSRSESHGQLNRGLPPLSPELANASEVALAVELLARIQAPSTATSYQAVDDLFRAEEALRDALDAHLDKEANRWSMRLVRSQLEFPYQCQTRFGLPSVNGVHVDLGCGSHNPLGRMFVHMMLGAREGICIDLDTPLDLARALRHLARLATTALLEPDRLFPSMPITREQILLNIADFDLARLSKGDPAGLSPRLRLIQGSIVETGLPDASVDAIFSNSVLEHLPDVDAALREWRRIIRPGGCALHGIDMKDHRCYGDPQIHPLEFLTDPPGPAILYNCNRLRLCDYDRKFTRGGFTTLDARRISPVDVPATLRSRMAAPWRDLPEEALRYTWGFYLLRRD
jgi:SAM-dependent methyltransferase